jgi:hypothetical protein
MRIKLSITQKDKCFKAWLTKPTGVEELWVMGQIDDCWLFKEEPTFQQPDYIVKKDVCIIFYNTNRVLTRGWILKILNKSITKFKHQKDK